MVVIVFRIKWDFPWVVVSLQLESFYFPYLREGKFFVKLQIETGILNTEFKCQSLKPASTEWANWDTLFPN